jgi:hypothetical protein
MNAEDKLNLVGWIMAPVAAIFLYALSIGPVGLIVKKAGGNGAALRQFYAPVIWLHDHTALKKPLEAYTNFWGVS